MVVPAAHGVVSLVSGPPPLELLPALFTGSAHPELTRAALLCVLAPTCAVSVAAWRFPERELYSEIDRAFARTFFAAHLAAWWLPMAFRGTDALDQQMGVAIPAAILLLYSASAASEHGRLPRARLLAHASFRCAGFWWTTASLAPGGGVSCIDGWYFGLVTAAYWAHIAHAHRWSSRAARFRSAAHYTAGCAAVAALAVGMACASPHIAPLLRRRERVAIGSGQRRDPEPSRVW